MQQEKLIKLIMDCFLEQNAHTPTRKDNTLGSVLTNEVQTRDNLKVTAPIDNSDHNVLRWEIECNINKELCSRAKLCFNKADYVEMSKFVSKMLQSIDTESISAGTLWHYFNSVMQKCIKRFVPVSTSECVRHKLL